MRGLWIDFGVLLAAFVGVYAPNGIEATREPTREPPREAPREAEEAGRAVDAAVSGMGASVGEIGDATLAYVRTDDPAELEKAREGRAGFEESRARYGEPAGTRSGARIDALYKEYAALSVTLADENDEQAAARAEVEESLAAVRGILGEQAREGIAPQGPSAFEKGQAASMSGAVAGVERSLEDHLEDPEAETLERGSRSAADFREALARFGGLPPDRSERERAEALGSRFDETAAAVNDMLALKASLRENRRRFSGLRADLEATLDEEGRAAAAAAAEEPRTLVLVVLAALLFALALVLFVGGGGAAYAARAAGRLARWSGDTAARVRRGDVGLGGNPIGYSTIARDITERKRSEENLRQQEDLLRAQSEIGEGLLIIEDGRLVYTNEAFSEISGYGAEELGALPSVLDLVVPEERTHFGERLRGWPGARYGDDRQETAILHKSGQRVTLETGIKAVEETDGRPRRIAIVRDITERKRAEERLTHVARYDHLTDLGNRVLFGEQLAGALARAYRGAKPVALMFVDLDRFKAVNDTLVHAFGDLLLKIVSERLRGCVRETDTVARMGGDEFGILLEGITAGEDAAVVARKIIDALSRPVDLDGHEVFVTCSIAVTPSSPDDALVRDADAAMYRAKQQGRNNYQFYTPEMNAQASRRLSLESSMRAALERGEFVLRYQPQVDLATGRISGAEVLLRWRPQDAPGLVHPDKFIHVLEDSGLIVPVGDWVLRTACAQGKAWEEAGLPPLRIAVNLSSRQFKGEDLVGSLLRILHETGLDPDCLELELTESLLMEDIAASKAMLDELRVLMGLKLSVDDFGTGYSSLSYLKRFPLDTLKIDQSFVRDIATDKDDAAIVDSIIGLAHSLDLGVIAEGVETEEQLAYLRDKGCDEVQGFYFSEPLPAEGFAGLLKRGVPLLSAPLPY